MKAFTYLRFLSGLSAMLPVVAAGATLTSVPMQGGMVMPMINYHAAEGTLSVEMPPEIPQLTPLITSNPLDSFAPADPWFQELDPSQQGLSFSRRYGFVMGAMSDPLPADKMIKIRCLVRSPGLLIYRYRVNPAVWEPIFGTAGSSDVYSWDAKMFHPAVVAPPGTNEYSALFEAFLADATTGEALAGGGTGSFTLKWTNSPDGRPVLNMASRQELRWPASAANYVVETCGSLDGNNWAPLTNAPTRFDTYWSLSVDPGTAAQFFRLRRAP